MTQGTLSLYCIPLNCCTLQSKPRWCWGLYWKKCICVQSVSFPGIGLSQKFDLSMKGLESVRPKAPKIDPRFYILFSKWRNCLYSEINTKLGNDRKMCKYQKLFALRFVTEVSFHYSLRFCCNIRLRPTNTLLSRRWKVSTEKLNVLTV